MAVHTQTDPLHGVAASLREARMWKRMLLLSNGNREEVSASENGNGSRGRIPAVMEPEGSGARLAGLGAEHAPPLLTDFEQIYQGGAVKPHEGGGNAE
jgi:hypothetical protein